MEKIKLTQEQINELGIYDCLIELAFNAHTKSADAMCKDDYELERKYKDLERSILIAAKQAFDNQTF